MTSVNADNPFYSGQNPLDKRVRIKRGPLYWKKVFTAWKLSSLSLLQELIVSKMTEKILNFVTLTGFAQFFY